MGAILTQNTSWRNVCRAIDLLKQDNLLTLAVLNALPVTNLADKIRSSGYYNLKARRLKNLLSFISENFGTLECFFDTDTATLRKFLLSINGVGPETADSILLYAACKPIFVIDNYTHRILCRHSIISEEAGYDEMQEVFMDTLDADVSLYNEYHALLVRLGKEFCKKNKPLCELCPLNGV